jgi:hypothetical protein
MAAISRIRPDQVLFTVRRQKMGNTTMKQTVYHRVTVREIDPEGRFVIATWNGNAPEKFYASEVARWKVSDPRLKKAS